MAEGVWRSEGRSGATDEGSGAGERAAEEACSRLGAGQGDPAGSVEADFLSPSRRRAVVGRARQILPVSERRACRVLGQHRSTQRHPPTCDAEEQRLTADIVALATDYGRYGYRRIHALLENSGWRVSRSAVERIWRREAYMASQRLTTPKARIHGTQFNSNSISR